MIYIIISAFCAAIWAAFAWGIVLLTGCNPIVIPITAAVVFLGSLWVLSLACAAGKADEPRD
jgi:hypothetical protein